MARVTVALSNNPGGATLGGTLTVTAQSGVATFSGLTLDKEGTGYTLLVTANGLTGADTSAFNVLVPTHFTVNSLGDSGTGSGTSGDLRYVLTQADQTPGATAINFSVTGTIMLNSALPDLSNTTGLMDIEGPGAASLTVARSSGYQTPSLFSVFTVDASVMASLTGLTISGGANDSGGGIDNAGTLTVTSSTITGNMAEDGGGIDNAGMLTISSSIINGNTAESGGGIYNHGSATVSTCTIDSNAAPYNSDGGIYTDGTMAVTSSTIAYNQAFFSGGGIGNGGTLTVANSTIAYNSATYLTYPAGGARAPVSRTVEP